MDKHPDKQIKITVDIFIRPDSLFLEQVEELYSSLTQFQYKVNTVTEINSIPD